MDQERCGELLALVSAERLRADVSELAESLPTRRLNESLPGEDRSTLELADAYLAEQLTGMGYPLTREPVAVQAYRCNEAKQPKSSWYERPEPDDPWYLAFNLYAKRAGARRPEEIVLLVAHKDSQSWIASPGAYDNAVGTAALLEIARVLAGVELARSVWWLWCNEEHTPWTSVAAARGAAARGDNLVAIYNTDSIGGRPLAWQAAGRLTNVTRYTCDEGLPFAEMFVALNERYRLGLEQTVDRRPRPGDDDGSFVNAGYRQAVMNLGSSPYQHDYYHDERDDLAGVDFVNVTQATRLILAAVVEVADRLVDDA